MPILENKLKNLALSAGAAAVGIGSRDRLSDAPASGDPAYLLPSTSSIISFAIPFSRKVLRDYFGKRSWRVFGENQKAILQTLYTINDLLSSHLMEQGHDAVGVDINCTYRPEEGIDDYIEMTEFEPDFSHQYGAVAAGLGKLGLSGNLLLPDHGAAVLLGTVLTSAKLQPDPLCDDNPCDRCGYCIQVCPVRMMDPRKTDKAGIAGVMEEIAAKRPHSCCWIGCGDYHGLEPGGKWSNWSPYRLKRPLPDVKEEMDDLLVDLRKMDPESEMDPNPYSDYRAVSFDPHWDFSATCGNCANICWTDREDRNENLRLILEGGVVVLNADGTREAVQGEVVELDTPHGLKVAVAKSEYEKIKAGGATPPAFHGHLEKDREVLESLYRKYGRRNVKTADES